MYLKSVDCVFLLHYDVTMVWGWWVEIDVASRATIYGGNPKN